MSTRLNIFASLLVLVLPLAACQHKPAEQAAAVAVGSATAYAPGQKARCPVTGEEFVVSASTVQVEHEGKHYAFCCADCQPGFAKNPAKYLQKN